MRNTWQIGPKGRLRRGTRPANAVGGGALLAALFVVLALAFADAAPAGASVTDFPTPPIPGCNSVVSRLAGCQYGTPGQQSTGTPGQQSTQPSCQGLLGVGADLLSGNAADLDRALVCGLFPASSGPGTYITQHLLAIPNYTQEETNVAQVGKNTSAVGLALLAATMTFSIIQYWLSGMVSMNGGMAGAQGIARAVAAALGIVLWPWAFGQIVALANSVSSAVVTGGVQSRLLSLLFLWSPLALATGVGLIGGIVLALAGLLLLLGLLAMKLAMGATLAVIFILMPIPMALWVLPSMAWLSRLMFKALIVIVVIPLIWAGVFDAFTAFASDTLTFGNLTLHGAGWWGTILRPLASIMFLFLLVTLPLKLAKLASLSALMPGGGGSGMSGGNRAADNAHKLKDAGASALGTLRGSASAPAAGSLAGLPGLGPGQSKKLDAWEKDFPDSANAADKTAKTAKLETAKLEYELGMGSWSDAFGKSMNHKEWSQEADDEIAKSHALDRHLPEVADGHRRARAQAMRGADQTFGGGHPPDDDKMEISRYYGDEDLDSYSGESFQDAVGEAVNARDQFSPEQQDALGGVYHQGGAETFAVYTSHLSYAGDLESEKRAAAQTLSGTHTSVLDAVFPHSAATGGGSAAPPAVVSK